MVEEQYLDEHGVASGRSVLSFRTAVCWSPLILSLAARDECARWSYGSNSQRFGDIEQPDLQQGALGRVCRHL